MKSVESVETGVDDTARDGATSVGPTFARRGYKYIGRLFKSCMTRAEQHFAHQLCSMSTRTIHLFLLLKVLWFLTVLTFFYAITTMPFTRSGLLMARSAVESHIGLRMANVDTRSWVIGYVAENVVWILGIIWLMYQHRKLSSKAPILPFRLPPPAKTAS
mmetsp:Transcript_4613/g.9905  ORF Transcript_4613/g.9905 Transcript_4613/m.9905 type:complete len:160 (-) Transcript_4613:782-1261(-)